jgi:ankyrin repeat protein
MKCGHLLLALASCFSVVGCSDPQEKSRAVLSQQKLDFSVDDYFRAAREGKLEAVESFLHAGMKPDVADADGNTALMLAAEAGHGHVVQFLIQQRANVNAARWDGDTPLIVAARQGDREAVRALLEAGADPEARNTQDLTPLAEATLEGRAAAVEVLAPKSRSSLDYSLQLAAVKGRTEVMDLLIKNGANVLARSSENRTPLMYAAKYGHEEAVRLLLERGSNALALDNDLQTAAMLAEAEQQPEAVAILNDPREIIDAPVLPDAASVLGASTAASPVQPPPAAAKLSGAQIAEPSNLEHTYDLKRVLKFAGYHERQLPFILKGVPETDQVAQVQLLTGDHKALEVAVGKAIPGTDFQVMSVKYLLKAAKSGKGKLVDVSTMLVRDQRSGERILAQLNLPVTAADSFGLLRETATGGVWETRPGDHFNVGVRHFRVLDIRPTQVLVEDRNNKETVILER